MTGYLFTITALVAAALVRIRVIPRLQMTPGRFQLWLETWVGFFAYLGKMFEFSSEKDYNTVCRPEGIHPIRAIKRFLGGEGVLPKKTLRRVLIVSVLLLAAIIAGIVLTEPYSIRHETIKEAMRDAVLHEDNRINFLGIAEVAPSLVSGYIVTAALLLLALLLRIFVIPRFQEVPGRFQMLLESWVGFFDKLARTNSPHTNKALGAYLFGAGSYIFVGTMFELFGFQALTTEGHSISLPAPLANINGAICMGVLSYLFILSGGIAVNRAKGVGKTLKEFSLPISMTFRLFGALLSGMLTTELVYYYITLSFVLPVIVGVLFTVLHALIQAYVLTMLTSFYYGEVTEVSVKAAKEKKKKKEPDTAAEPAA